MATADVDDAHHRQCRELLEADPGPLVTSPLVIAEAAYLIDRQLGPGAEGSLQVDHRRVLSVESLTHDDWPRVGDLVQEYADLRLGGTDASLIALAERLGTAPLATLNRRDFVVVRPQHVEALELLPAVPGS